MTVRLRLDTREFRRLASRFSKVGVRRAAASALNRVSLDVIEAQQFEIRTAGFDFSTGATRNFLTGRQTWIPFKGASTRRLTSIIQPRKRARPYLERQAKAGGLFGRTGVVTPETAIKLGNQIAIPVEVPTSGARGRVPPSYLPGAALEKQKQRARSGTGRGRKPKQIFVAGNAVLERIGAGVRVLFALKSRPRFKKRYDFHRTTRKAVKRNFVPKLRQEFIKEARRNAGGTT